MTFSDRSMFYSPARERALVLIAGGVADYHISGLPLEQTAGSGPGSEWQRFVAAVSEAKRRPGSKADLDQFIREAHDLVCRRVDQVERLAKALLRLGTMTGPEIRGVLNGRG